MSDFFLDLRNQTRVVDFLQDFLEYAEGQEREAAQKLVTMYQDGGHFSTTTLAEAARRLSKAVFSARSATQMYLAEEGTELEWERMLAALRPSTAHLLERVRKSAKTTTLETTLKHADADSALTTDDRKEISEVRQHVELDVWREKRKALHSYVQAAQKELTVYLKRLNALRELAGEMPQPFQNEIFSKLERYEDRILFEGEAMPVEILDDEVRYYTDQKEISPLES